MSAGDSVRFRMTERSRHQNSPGRGRRFLTMLTRLRSTWLAAGGAILLVLSLTGVVAATALVAAVVPAVAPAAEVDEPVDTTTTFEDLDGDGIDDDCDEEVVEDAEAAAAAEAAADLDGDGTLSVSEAARSNRVGGKNCNHGGYVSTVAHDLDEDAEEEEPAEEEPAEEEEETPAECETASDEEPAEEEPAEDEEADTAPNAHGKAVSEVAKSDAVGGKNCNHGGAVSEEAKKNNGHDADKQKGPKEKGERGKGHAKKNGG
jgi:hypothetical protein